MVNGHLASYYPYNPIYYNTLKLCQLLLALDKYITGARHILTADDSVDGVDGRGNKNDLLTEAVPSDDDNGRQGGIKCFPSPEDIF